MREVYRFYLQGCFVPYVRMTQKGKFVKHDAQAYLSSQEALRWQFAGQMEGRDRLTLRTRLQATIRIHHNHGFHGRDIDNEAKAILDAMRPSVFTDDRWIDRLLVVRERWPVDEVLVEVMELEPGEGPDDGADESGG